MRGTETLMAFLYFLFSCISRTFLALIFFGYAVEQKQTPDWQFLYFLFLMYVPNVSRMNFFGYATDKFFLTHMNYLFYWQVFYTGLYIVLLVVYINAFSRKNTNTSP